MTNEICNTVVKVAQITHDTIVHKAYIENIACIITWPLSLFVITYAIALVYKKTFTN